MLELSTIVYPDIDNFPEDNHNYYLSRMAALWGDELVKEWTESLQNHDSKVLPLNKCPEISPDS